jgi:hypothetical protein
MFDLATKGQEDANSNKAIVQEIAGVVPQRADSQHDKTESLPGHVANG